MRVKSLRVKARVKIYMRVFCMDFSWKSAILHAIYACVSAAMPMACTVSTDRDMAYSSKCETTVFEIQIQDIRTPSPPPPTPHVGFPLRSGVNPTLHCIHHHFKTMSFVGLFTLNGPLLFFAVF